MDTGRDANGVKALNRHTLEQIVAASSVAILVLDARDTRLPVVYANPAYERLTGFALAELTGHAWALLARETVGDEENARVKAAVERHEACHARIADRHKDGRAWQGIVSLAPLHDAHGETRYMLCELQPVATPEIAADAASGAPANAAPIATETLAEVSPLQRELGRTRQKAPVMDRIDSATGLLKFGYFQETVRRDLVMAHRDRRAVTLLVFEIPEFDTYRRTFGDKAADSCLRMIGAQIMRTLRRAGDLCARYDESTLIAAVVGQEPGEIQPLAEQIADNVRQLKLHNPRAKSSRYVSVRVAVVGCPPGVYDDPEPIVARALAESRGNDARLRAVPA